MTPRRGRRTGPSTFDRRLLLPMIGGAVLNPVNSSLIAVALVPIGLALGAPATETAWLVSGLYLATAVGQPVTGRLVDLYGPRPLYLAGAVLVGVGGALGALAPDIWWLVAGRVVIGLGTCAGYPAAMALIRGEADRTGTDSPEGVLTVLSIATSTIAVVGPSLGGLLLGVSGWRAVFVVNIPLALLCLVLGALRLPRTRVAHRGVRAALRRVDPPGIALFAVTTVALLLALLHPDAGAVAPALVAVAAGAGLVVRELRTPEPFLDLRVLGGNLPLLLTFVRALLTATVSYCVLYGFTQWLEQGRGLTPATAGLVLLPIFVTGIGVTALTGRRRAIRGKLLVGGVAQVLLAALLFALGPASPVWVIVVVALLAGLPQGLNNLAVQNAVYRQADPERVASSAGLMRTFFYLGAIAASAAGGIAFGGSTAGDGLPVLAAVMLVASTLFVLLTLADRSLARLAGPEGAPS
ncbi:putative drug resistance transporter, EmrB/QacA family protein [Pseudonocardia sp. Ae406_Ps2]|uniref:MFS transporter n=1 Tax=unclassified Pseudonocardia TaxID=2619320 RepID=UPI00094B1D0A|nr:MULTISPECIES: MFS transporter [unclassified Pseudonocardia]OLL97116.1 putative drug resistance transporter, EmrB/QacA family protein [Pseudonocardia sp. Ae331_Ps2]OLM05174.1 putative drug resistance transporter, EmrB/QacA family protein [Pseudonocardia sp. Ae406_Ps2]OLM26745.1 putative drug resistance transporter, EmrB/QacA family protein [Pseudonocardia sp. Ae706_Ps2]OLM33185.1 putative drug resistance transporter, EmrB/QacA family protein [Pseudonocardia sp. Ae717_Ps2]